MKEFSFRNRLRSFRFAFVGIGRMLASQHNAWIHASVTIAVVLVGFYFGFTRDEWSFIIVAIVAVWVAEALNTSLELLADVTSPEFHPLVEKAKDVAAGAVLISSIGAAIIGLIVIIPYLF